MKRIGILVLLVAVVLVAQFGASATPANALPSLGGPVLSAPVAGAHSTCSFAYFNVAISGLVVGGGHQYTVLSGILSSTVVSKVVLGSASVTTIPRFTYLVYNNSTTLLPPQTPVPI